MINQTNQVKKNASQAFDTAHNILNISLENIKTLTNLQLKMSKAAVEKTSTAIKNMASVKNPQELLAQANQFATDAFKSNITNYNTIIEVIADTKSKIGQIVQSQLHSIKANTATNLPSWMAKFKTNKFDAASVVNSFVNSANNVFSNAAKLANESNSSLLSATGSVVKTAKKAAKKNIATSGKAVAKNIATSKKAAAKTAATAKKAATKTIKTVINSAKKTGETVVEAAKKSADAAQGYSNTASTTNDANKAK